jgi:methylenetetrahydrofolate reductase (NADPH)
MRNRKIKDIIEEQGQSISFEFFPPKTEEAERRLFVTVKKLGTLNPSFVSVTYGAGGGTRETTGHVVERISRETPLVVMPHLTCIGQSEEELKSILSHYQGLGIENILALRGDLPQGAEGLSQANSNCHADDTVRLAAAFDAFSIGVAVYPEGHVEAPSPESDLLYTRQKIEAGADFAITQMFFDNRFYYDYVERAERIGIHVPIIPGIMPVTDIGKVARFCDTCGTTLPSSLIDRMESATSPEDAEKIGVDFTTKQVIDLWRNGVRFLHFYTLNRADIVTEILRNLSLERLLSEAAEEELALTV